MYVGEDEPVSLDSDARFDRNRRREHRSIVRKRVELAALAARVDRRRQLGEKARVEVAPGECAIELARVHARDPRTQAGGDHLSRERRRAARVVEQRKQRRQARAREPFLAVASDVREKQVGERDMREPFADRARDRCRHRAFVHLVRTRRGDRHLPERQTDGTRLRLEQVDTDRVHGHPLRVRVDRRQQRAEVDAALAQHVEHPCAVFAAAPGDEALAGRHLVIWLLGYLVIWLFWSIDGGWWSNCICTGVSEFSDRLKERCMSFAVAVLSLVDRLPLTAAGRVVAFQLAKSATSVAANYRATCLARSRREFIAKLGTVVEEADESACWLELIERRRMLPTDDVHRFLVESLELRNIFGKSLATARANARKTSTSPLPHQITR